ncbi:MAG: PAS domain S-box protein [Promethearchaeota archaeon]|nr:MAG: PAS domain S-box protein [Candidatus Lokiarchaeota archaeon]
MIGELPNELKDAFLESIPLDISILDKDDNVLGWNKHETRIFKRPEAVIGKNVRNCHPKKSLHKVEQILDEFKSGERDKARFWIDLDIEGETRKVLIEYFALRDQNGEYMGCLEASQDITDTQNLSGEQRLLE